MRQERPRVDINGVAARRLDDGYARFRNAIPQIGCRTDAILHVVLFKGLIQTHCDSGSKLPRMLGGISFVYPDYVKEARASSSTLHNFMFAAVLRDKKPFLAPKQVAIENVRGTLNLMNFFGNFDPIDLSDAELANFYTVSNEGYRFFHFGYNYRVM